MKTISYNDIVSRVAELCRDAARNLPPDVAAALERAQGVEESPGGRAIIGELTENARIAHSDGIPICQDTGVAVFFVDLGDEIRVDGGTLVDAINEGTRRGYRDAFLRASIVTDPVFGRKNTGDNTPAAIHIDLVPGDRLAITLLPKGGGCENASALAMLKPSDGTDGIVAFVANAVVRAGANACPPVIVGVGIGGTADIAVLIAKKALLRPVGTAHADARYARLEKTILDNINASGIGPQGLGGRVTALAVHVEHRPCHIASLPVAVSVNCHAARVARAVW